MIQRHKAELVEDWYHHWHSLVVRLLSNRLADRSGLHGEGVAVGTMLAADLSRRMGNITQADVERIEALFKLGYAGKHQLDQSVLDLLQAESQYVAKINKLSTLLPTLKPHPTP